MVHNGTLYFIHADRLGRPEAVTNSARSVVWSSEGNAFGNVPVVDLIGGFNVGLPGQYYDIESGMYYNYFRTYDSLSGRYLQSDPIGQVGGLNTFSYAGGNPLNFVDPLGLFRESGNSNPLILNIDSPAIQSRACSAQPGSDPALTSDGRIVTGARFNLGSKPPPLGNIVKDGIKDPTQTMAEATAIFSAAAISIPAVTRVIVPEIAAGAKAAGANREVAVEVAQFIADIVLDVAVANNPMVLEAINPVEITPPAPPAIEDKQEPRYKDYPKKGPRRR